MATHPPLLRFQTHPATALRVVAGANAGDGVGLGDDVVPGDIYRLTGQAASQRLAISDSGSDGPCVAESSEVGAPGDPLAISACHTLMGPSGEVVEILILTHEAQDGVHLHVLPLSTLKPDTEYELVGSETASAPEKFADIASVSFLAGTHLTLASGKPMPC